MKTRLPPTPSPEPRAVVFPDAGELAMLRAGYAGMPVRNAVERYLPDCRGSTRYDRVSIDLRMSTGSRQM